MWGLFHGRSALVSQRSLSSLPVCKQAMKAKRAAGVAMARGKNAPKQLNTAGRVNKVSTK